MSDERTERLMATVSDVAEDATPQEFFDALGLDFATICDLVRDLNLPAIRAANDHLHPDDVLVGIFLTGLNHGVILARLLEATNER